MGKTVVDQKVREALSEFGKRGGAKTKATRPADYYSKLGKKSWNTRMKRLGKKGLSAQMSKVGKKSAALRQKRIAVAERKRGLYGIGKRITGFLEKGNTE